MIKTFMIALSAALLLTACSKSDESSAGNTLTAASAPAAPSAAPAVSTSTNNLTMTASGLGYEVLKHGTGTVSPKPSDTVKVDYTGVLLNGTVFDSSIPRGQPAEFRLDQVITGWTEGLQLMKVGDKFRFVIPPNLGYGSASPGGAIPPNSTLVFEVELLAIK